MDVIITQYTMRVYRKDAMLNLYEIDVSRWPHWLSDDGNVLLVNADCLEVLPVLPKVDCVVTDPPYGNDYSTGRRTGVVRASTRITGDILSAPILNDTVDKLAPILNDTAFIYWFAAPDRLDMVLPLIRRWTVVNVLAWDKGNCTAGDLECAYGKQWEACVYAVVNKLPLVGSRDRDILKFNRINGCDYVHPTQKPVDLIEYLISKHSCSNVIDPFTGSGTTGVACVRLGRQFIGIEKEEKYYEIAIKRIKAEQERFPLFEKPTKQEAKPLPGFE